MQAPLPHPDLDRPPSSSSPPRPRRSPPPGHYDWQPFAIEYNTPLPVLPPIRDLALAAQARTTKQYLAWQDGRKGTHDFTDEDEARSFRRLEWVGDGVLHDLYAVALYRLFPRAKSDLLSVRPAAPRHRQERQVPDADLVSRHPLQRMRGAVASNNVHSYLGWQYRLDERILEPPVAAGGKLARPFREVQVYSADLLEAHIGALVVEGRRAEVEDWVAELFSSASVEIEAAVEAFDSPHAKGGNRANKKRVASQPGFQNGTDMGEQDRLFVSLSRRGRLQRAPRLTQYSCAQIPSHARAASRTSPTAARRPRVLWRGRTASTTRTAIGTATSSRATATRRTRSGAARRARGRRPARGPSSTSASRSARTASAPPRPPRCSTSSFSQVRRDLPSSCLVFLSL